MRACGEPACLMDYWMQDTLREMDEAAAAGDLPPAHTGDGEIGGHVFDFLFAAQDASTSSLCDFRRHATEGCDGLAYIPTITPRDDCAVHLKPRSAELPSF